MQGLTYKWGRKSNGPETASPLPKSLTCQLLFDGVPLWKGDIQKELLEWCRDLARSALERRGGTAVYANVSDFLTYGLVPLALASNVLAGRSWVDEDVLRDCIRAHGYCEIEGSVLFIAPSDESIRHVLVVLETCVALHADPDRERTNLLERLKWRILRQAVRDMEFAPRGDEFLVRALLGMSLANREA